MNLESTDSEEDLLALGQMRLILNGLRARHDDNMQLRNELRSLDHDLERATHIMLRLAALDPERMAPPMIN